MRTIHHIPLLLCTLAFIVIAILWPLRVLPRLGAAPRPPVISVQTPTVPLGGVAFIRIDAPGAETVHPVCDGRALAAVKRSEGQWEVLIPVWMEEAPGPRTVAVTAEVDGHALRGEAAFSVTTRTFPTQRLRMSSQQDAMYESPEVEEEYRVIRAAINHASPERWWQGAFPLPVQGRISTQYGTQRYRNGKKVGIHRGIDIAAPAGTLVTAANAGVVVLRGEYPLHGRTLVIDHGGGVTGLYIHLRDFGVSQGQRVDKGQKIARVGATGVATGPHLHYALYVHGVAVDPLLLRTLPAEW